MTLRPYQRETVTAVIEARRQGCKRMLVCLPTGSGKTVIFSHLASLARRPVLVLAHREELLTQARDKIQNALGDHRVVAIERGMDRASADAHVLVCSIRSLHEQRLSRVMQDRHFGLVIYDECHHAAAQDNRRVLSQLGVFEPDWQGTLLGFTATTTRGDGQGLHEIFERIVYTRTLPEMIRDGYLCPLRGFRISTASDLRELSNSGQDFREDELEAVINVEERNALVARSIQELARDRRTIAFCVTVAHARALCKALNHLGVPSGMVHGQMPSERRASELASFRQGKTTVLTNVAVLTEGFDDPGVSCVAMARPTRSEGMYAQCVGRGTRLFPGKRDCMILDFVDVSKLRLCTLPSLFGMPYELNLLGEEALGASQRYERIVFDYPGFEWEAGEITLREIQQRAKQFDPLGLQLPGEVRAISNHGWVSLGSRGLALHFEKRAGQITEVLVLARAGHGKRWEVSMDGKVVERFSTVEQAVEAVDYEVRKLGPRASASALAQASWRPQQAPPNAPAWRGRIPKTKEEALRLEAFRKVTRKA
ncbi:MAG TPA: DEAD/DEAH box helicase [Polyangiaceae bacterium]|jgi:superfamily II DNA or RNA helicase|nr:DEAD/DEAH box helicase [Polyangiaceae bacterium]HNZ22611.1 DEAD/DEAH box helicase [Polyangiaceae bacterium]HOD21506.1 DEAD/DEAH box helicase [Polyangiaceae bacterium]HOE48390.1 DEAD/DEAH box helicase [Polyangiaceae bacterium]HOH00280.1 DEAD/DEAH box helicase [Polyangiaceae bacterium]